MMRAVSRIALVALVLCASMLGVVACGDDDGGGGGAKGPDINAKGEGRVNIVNWEGYTDPSYVKGFEQETGCKVNDVFAGTSDEMFTKFRSGGGGQYDLASFSGDASLRAIKSGSVAELDTSKLTNYNDLAKQLQSPSFNTQDGKHYGLSFMWGANVLIYNADKIKENLDSWNVLYDPKYKGRITVPDNPIQIADPALQFFGADDPYSIDQATLDKVKAKLKQQRPLVRKYWVLATDFEQLAPDDGRPEEGRPERQGGAPQGGRHRLVGLVDAVQERTAPDLRLPVHELRDEAGRAEAGRRCDRVQPREPQDV
jgi:spermidine/putrescine-binding protein